MKADAGSEYVDAVTEYGHAEINVAESVHGAVSVPAVHGAGTEYGHAERNSEVVHVAESVQIADAEPADWGPAEFVHVAGTEYGHAERNSESVHVAESGQIADAEPADLGPAESVPADCGLEADMNAADSVNHSGNVVAEK
ncbi:unnamed protein product [Camellia sinensis]